MRRRPDNFAIGLAISVAAHGLLALALRYMIVTAEASHRDLPAAPPVQVTLVLNPDPEVTVAAKVPETDSPPDLIGESNAKGTATHNSAGDQPLRAREADQDQPLFNVNPLGKGKLNNLPAPDAAPPGQDGTGGQRGRPQVAAAPAAPKSPAPPAPPALPKEVKDPEEQPSVLPKPSPLKEPTPVAPALAPPKAVTPPPSKTASIGAAAADLKKPPVDGVNATAPLVQVPAVKETAIPAAPAQGPSVTPIHATGTAPPTPAAPVDHKSVAVAPPLPLPPAPVAAPPPQAVEKSQQKQKAEKTGPVKAPAPPVQIASAAPARVNTGDGQAPGQDHRSTGPAQESDMDSDPFLKKPISAEFHDGKVDVRDGRKVKLTRPHILPGGMVELYTHPETSVVLAISIDEAGKVKHVGIAQTSGFVQVDTPCRVAAYDWWIEPTRDKNGRPMADVVLFNIQFR